MAPRTAVQEAVSISPLSVDPGLYDRVPDSLATAIAKIQGLGLEAQLDLDEAAAVLSFSVSTFERLGIPCLPWPPGAGGGAMGRLSSMPQSWKRGPDDRPDADAYGLLSHPATRQRGRRIAPAQGRPGHPA